MTDMKCSVLFSLKNNKNRIPSTTILLSALTLILLNNLISHNHFWLSANQITSYNVFVQIHKLNDKHCRSWSDGFFRSHLIWIYNVCEGRGCREQQDKGLRLSQSVKCKSLQKYQYHQFMQVHLYVLHLYYQSHINPCPAE